MNSELKCSRLWQLPHEKKRYNNKRKSSGTLGRTTAAAQCALGRFSAGKAPIKI